MSKCTEEGEEERRAKEDGNICADLDGGLGGSGPQSAAIKDLMGFQTVLYKRKVVLLLKYWISSLLFVVPLQYITEKNILVVGKGQYWEGFDGISTVGTCDQRGSSWLCAEGPSRLTLL